MTKRELLSVALKVSGVVLLAQSAAEVPHSIQLIAVYTSSTYAGTLNPLAQAWMWGLTSAIGLAAAALMLLKAEAIAQFLARGSGTAAPTGAAEQARCLLTIALKVVGAVLAAVALPSIVGSISDAYQRASAMGDYSTAFVLSLLGTNWAAPVSALVSIAIGVYLALGTRGLVKLISSEEP